MLERRVEGEAKFILCLCSMNSLLKIVACLGAKRLAKINKAKESLGMQQDCHCCEFCDLFMSVIISGVSRCLFSFQV